MYQYNYPRPALTADVVLFVKNDKETRVLLIRRGKEPFMDSWALPGGFVDENEDIKDAALRELKEETGIVGLDLIQVGAYGKPGRDPRGHTVSVVYTAILDSEPEYQAGDDAAEAGWFTIDELPGLAFDHEEIITDAARMLKLGIPVTVTKN